MVFLHLPNTFTSTRDSEEPSLLVALQKYLPPCFVVIGWIIKVELFLTNGILAVTFSDIIFSLNKNAEIHCFLRKLIKLLTNKSGQK